MIDVYVSGKPDDEAAAPLFSRRRRHLDFHDQTGDTLIEVLVAVLILGISAVGIFGAYTMSIVGSAQHRNMAAMDVGLRNIAEAATYQIQNQPFTALFTSCARVSGAVTVTPSGSTVGSLYYNNTAISLPPLTLPASTTYSLNATSNQPSIQYWSGGSWQPSGCSMVNDSPQMITLTATGPNGIIQLLSFVVTDQSYLAYRA